ncbi:hypothetical protein CFP71_38120 [Amycolatopsis thailandensis]|uniref:DUF3592 domain-containing protein n=1 Tax=Amycolatopsis thailandensis TaxID=589330 RepID=A0A229RGD7_9PSEU|nr:hypothetical protein [Amycolatopsis thailandensis]OXM45733.1 hypothetical protein CFP71_38120 [Amycolatopsis thailandensis]
MPGKPRKSRILFSVLAGVSFVYLIWAIVGSVGDRVHELKTGEDVTVSTVSGCTKGGPPMSGPLPYCEVEWRFDDGRAGRGRIEGERVAEGDRVFAGDGVAYQSRASRIWGLSLISLFGLALSGMWISLLVLGRREQIWRRRKE